MDIYSAENYLTKILTYVKSISNDGPNLYQKSKIRYRNMISMCNEISRCMCDIIADSSMCETDDSAEIIKPDNEITLESLYEEVSKLKELFQYQSSLQSVATSIDQNESISDSEHSASNVPSISSKTKKSIMHKYLEFAKDSDTSRSTCQEVNECTRYIKEWITKRFIQNSDGFRFKLSKLPIWLTHYVIAYYHYWKSNNLHKFDEDIHNWYSDISDKHLNYPTPYSVHSIINSDLSSVLDTGFYCLWMNLMETYFEPLSKVSPPEYAVTIMYVVKLLTDNGKGSSMTDYFNSPQDYHLYGLHDEVTNND